MTASYIFLYIWSRFDPPNTLDLLLQMTWNGVNMFLKFLVKQLRQRVFFGAIWLLHLAKEVAYKTLVHPQLEYAAPIWHPYNETEIKKKGGESAEDSSQVDLQAMAEQE